VLFSQKFYKYAVAKRIILMLSEVENIASNDFNKELKGYIGKRRSQARKGFKFKFPSIEKKKSEQVQSADDGELRAKSKPRGIGNVFSFRKKAINEAVDSENLTPEEMAKLRAMEDDVEETEKEIVENEKEVKELKHEEADLEAKREGMLGSIFSKINVFKKRQVYTIEVPDEELEKEPVLDREVVQVLKMMHKWLEELPDSKKRAFRQSPDFQKYKAVLEKYGLVKKKE
jgi:hypothetical protein